MCSLFLRECFSNNNACRRRRRHHRFFFAHFRIHPGHTHTYTHWNPYKIRDSRTKIVRKLGNIHLKQITTETKTTLVCMKDYQKKMTVPKLRIGRDRGSKIINCISRQVNDKKDSSFVLSQLSKSRRSAYFDRAHHEYGRGCFFHLLRVYWVFVWNIKLSEEFINNSQYSEGGSSKYYFKKLFDFKLREHSYITMIDSVDVVIIIMINHFFQMKFPLWIFNCIALKMYDNLLWTE